MVTKRNADGQFPKKYFHGAEELHERMGFTAGQTAILCMEWNKLIREGLADSEFLQRADMLFTKHQILLLFTLSNCQG